MSVPSLLLQVALTALGSAATSRALLTLPQALIKKIALLLVALVLGILALVLAITLALFWLFPQLSPAEGLAIMVVFLAAAALACYLAGRDMRSLTARLRQFSGFDNLSGLMEAFNRGWRGE